MAKGKFEAGKGGVKSVGRADPYAVRNKPAKQEVRNRLWPILAAVAGVAVLVIGILILNQGGNKLPVPAESSDAPISTRELLGMPRAQLEQRFAQLDSQLKQDLALTLEPAPADPQRTEAPILLTLSSAESGAGLDLTKLKTDLDAGVGQEQGDSYLLDPRDYLTLDEQGLRRFLQSVADEYGTKFEPSSVTLEDAAPEDAPKDEEAEAPRKVLIIRTGLVGRDFTADQLFDSVKAAYETVLVAEEPEAAMKVKLSYPLQVPDPVDPEELSQLYCKEPVNAALDKKSGDITPEEDGFGFDKEELSAALAAAEPGAELRVPLTTLHPEIDAKFLSENLFQDVVGEAHTKHTSNSNRTTNLKLACAAIDGTIVLPGETFSFNETVGERTEAKGYKEALAYVSGGQSKPETGGGICQVASSIYYAVLQADLNTVAREPHMFMVDYVPFGMDATVYWGYLDYKFENSSPFPIQIEASVSGGKVHIVLHGTEWKDYTVELSYEILETDPWTTVEKEVPNDGTYSKGQVITTPYTGYKVATYKTTHDRETGKKLETTQIGISRYNRRDRVVAKPVGEAAPRPTQPTPTQPKPTQPTPTQPKPTEPAPTQPKPTEPKPTEPKPTEPKPTEPKPTEPAPTEPKPTEPAPTESKPTEPAPTEPKPTEPAPTEPAPTEPAPSEPDPGEEGG